MQHIDLFTWLRGDILVKADKITMAELLELRVPFLDSEVQDRRNPPSTRRSRTAPQVRAAKALEQIVPPHVLHWRKLGLVPSGTSWPEPRCMTGPTRRSP